MDYLLNCKPVCTPLPAVLQNDYVIWVNFPWVCVSWLRQQVPFSPRQPASSRVQSHCSSARLWEPSRYLAWMKRVNYQSGGNSRQLGRSRGWDRMGIGCVYMRARVTAEALCQDYGAKQGALSVSRLVLGEDSGWTGHTAVPGCSAARHSGVQ